MVFTSDRSASGVMNSRLVDSERSMSSLANSSTLVKHTGHSGKLQDLKQR